MSASFSKPAKEWSPSDEANVRKHILQSATDKTLSLDFPIDQPDTTLRIKLTIIAIKSAVIRLDATITIEQQAVNSNVSLDIIVITSDTARVVASPNLIIRNSQSRASHSVKTIRLDNSELFYLASRGLNREQADKLLLDSIKKEAFPLTGKVAGA